MCPSCPASSEGMGELGAWVPYGPSARGARLLRDWGYAPHISPLQSTLGMQGRERHTAGSDTGATLAREKERISCGPLSQKLEKRGRPQKDVKKPSLVTVVFPQVDLQGQKELLLTLLSRRGLLSRSSTSKGLLPAASRGA